MGEGYSTPWLAVPNLLDDDSFSQTSLLHNQVVGKALRDISGLGTELQSYLTFP